MKSKKYYWIKLKTDFFNREDIDFMLSQENGCEYVVLYQMLCLNTANNDGRLETQMNEVIIPYDIKKIVRDTKYFDTDTVMVALDLYKKLGIIYEEDNKILRISNYQDMIGSETAWAEKKRLYREKQKLLLDNVGDNVLEENRDKRLENRDKSIDLDTTTIYEYVEQNFGRPLSPTEVQKIESWLLSYDPSIIKYAVEVATLNNKRTFNYVNGILNNWKTAGYTTIQEIKENEIKRKEDKTMTEEEKEQMEFINSYNWLEDEGE